MFSKYAFFLVVISLLPFCSSVCAQNQSRIDSIRSALERVSDDRAKLGLLNRLSMEYDDVNANQLHFAEQAYKLAVFLNEPLGKADALANQGCYYFGQLRNYRLAKPFFDKSLALCAASPSSDVYAAMGLKIGRYMNENSTGGLAKPYLLHSYLLFKAARKNNELASASRELALAYAFLRQKDSSFFYWNEYGNYAKSQSDDFLLADWYALASRLYGEFFKDESKQLDNFRKASDLYDHLLQKKRDLSSVYLAYAHLHANRCKVYWLENKLSELKANSLEVLKLCQLMHGLKMQGREVNELRWTAYASLIRACISAKDISATSSYIGEGTDFFHQQKDFYHLGKLLWSVESSYWRFSEYFKAYEFQIRELEVWDNLGNIYWKCIAMANQAMVFGRLGDLQRQMECIRQLLVLSNTNNVTAFTLYANKDMAKSYFLLNRLDSAQSYIIKAKKQNTENENPFITMVIYYIEALVQEKQGRRKEAIDLLKKAWAIKRQYAYPTNTYDQVAPESALARVYLASGDLRSALQMAVLSLDLSKKENMKDMQAADYMTLAGVYKKMRDYEKMSFCLEKNIELNTDLAKDEAEKAIHKREIENINKKNGLERSLLMKEKDLKQAQLKIQLIWTWVLLLAFLVLVLFLYFLYRGYRRKIADNLLLSEQKAEITEKNEELKQLNEEISTQRDNLFALNEQTRVQHDEICVQNMMITRQQKDITDSIVYASRIQQAMIPSFDELTSNFPNSFVLFLPRDIVSGDFYWVKQVRNQLYILVADCTGHGVPGAFMSMLGISLMNEMISSRHIDPPGFVLTDLRKRLKRSLHQDDSDSDSKDGMDASLVLIDLDSRKLQFAGAYNPLYIIRKSGRQALPEVSDTKMYELSELCADRMPIGIHPHDDNPFTNQTVMLEKGDRLYLFSDGYVSQFGGEKGGKFKTKQFKELLLAIQGLGMYEQKVELFSAFEQWKGSQWSQVDDILVLGLEV